MFKKVRKFNLVTTISILLVAGFLITSLASYFVSRAALRAEINLNELPLTSDNIYTEIQRDLLRPVFVSSLMATDTFLRDWVLAGEIGEHQLVKYLKEIKTTYNAVTSFFVSEKTRNYYYSGGILKQVAPDEERDRWYFRVRDMAADYEINVDPDFANKDAMTIFINYRVFDYDHNYIGATGVGLTVRAVKELIELYQQKYNRTIYFVDRDGEVKLAGSGFDKTTTNLTELDFFGHFREPLASKTESSFSYRQNGETVHTNIRFIEEFDWFLVVEQSEQQTIEKIYTTLLINLGICLGITLVVLWLVNLSITAYQQRIDTLRGIVPICSHCKQIRDDQGYWNRVEAYITQHTDARFSHSICPACMKKHYDT